MFHTALMLCAHGPVNRLSGMGPAHTTPSLRGFGRMSVAWTGILNNSRDLIKRLEKNQRYQIDYLVEIEDEVAEDIHQEDHEYWSREMYVL